VKKLNEDKQASDKQGGAGDSNAISKAIAAATKKGAANVDLRPVAQDMMAKYGGAIQGAEGPVIAAFAALVAKLKAMLNIDAQVTLHPRLTAPIGATPGAGAAPATPGKQSRNGGNVYIQHASFHGVNDPKKLHEQVMAHANRSAARTNFAALHDIDTGGVG
jgi:hypothetical protein